MKLAAVLLLVLTSTVSLAQPSAQPTNRFEQTEREMRATQERKLEERQRARHHGQKPASMQRSASTPLIEGNWSNVFSYENSIDGGTVYAMLEVGDSLFIAGDFTRFKGIEAYHVALMNTKTGAVTALDFGLSASCYALAFHDGKLYAGGDFDYAGEVYAPYIAMYENGKWSAMGVPNSSITSLAIYQNKLVAGGYFTAIDSKQMLGIATYDGAKWDDLDGGLQYSNGYAGSAEELLVVGDSLFVGGDFTHVGSEVSYGVAMFHNGWHSLGFGITTSALALAMHEGKLYMGGDFVRGSMQDVISPFIIAWNGDTYETVARGYDGFVGEMRSVGGALYVGGQFVIPGTTSSGNIAKLEGGVWSAMGSGTYGIVNALAGSGDRLFVGGNFTQAGGNNVQSFAAYDRVDEQWATGFTRGVTNNFDLLKVDVLANTENFVYVGGRFLRAAGKNVNNIAAWNKDTGEWTEMEGGVDGEVRAITVRGQEVFVGGFFGRAGETAANHIARWDEAMQTWSPLGEGSFRTVDAIEVDDQYVYSNVFFDMENETYAANMGRWDGAQWQSLTGEFYGYLNDIHRDGSKLYVAGYITQVDGEDVNNVAVFENGMWSGLGGGIEGRPTRLTTAHGKLYAAGAITGNFEEKIYGLMQFDGNKWTNVGLGLDDYAYALHTRGNSVFIGGWFTEAGGDDMRWIAEWDGQNWKPIPGGIDHVAYAITSDDESIYFGGYLGRAGEINSWRIARFDVESSDVKQDERSDARVVYDPVRNAVSLIGDASFERAIVYDLMGREVARVQVRAAGERYEAVLPDLSSGTYLVRFVGEESVSGVILR